MTGSTLIRPTITPLRGVDASKPAANAVPVGTLYEGSDTGVVYMSTGAAWVFYDADPTWSLIRNGGNPFRESFPYEQSTAVTVVLAATGIMHHVGVPCVAGDVITNISIRWGTTGVAVPSNWWFALYSPAATPALIGQSADQTSTVITASAVATLALVGGPYTLTATGMHYVGVMVVSGGAQPTLTGRQFPSSALAAGIIAGQKRLVGTSGSALTGTAPGTITSVSNIAGQFYAVLS